MIRTFALPNTLFLFIPFAVDILFLKMYSTINALVPHVFTLYISRVTGM